MKKDIKEFFNRVDEGTEAELADFLGCERSETEDDATEIIVLEDGNGYQTEN